MKHTVPDFGPLFTIPPERVSAMHAAAAHAESDSAGWTSLAAAFLATYAATHSTFTGEDVVTASKGIVPEPPTDRAWGAVFNGASRRGEIVKTGDFKARVNGSPQFVWRKP